MGGPPQKFPAQELCNLPRTLPACDPSRGTCRVRACQWWGAFGALSGWQWGGGYAVKPFGNFLTSLAKSIYGYRRYFWTFNLPQSPQTSSTGRCTSITCLPLCSRQGKATGHSQCICVGDQQAARST
eukprot:3023995-Rhodomonas_salina.1